MPYSEKYRQAYRSAYEPSSVPTRLSTGALGISNIGVNADG